MKTLDQVTAANPYPSWSRQVSTDRGTGLNVAALRARTASVSALAPFDCELQLADGTRLPLVLVSTEVEPKGMKLVVRLPQTNDAEALAALLSEACRPAKVPEVAA